MLLQKVKCLTGLHVLVDLLPSGSITHLRQVVLSSQNIALNRFRWSAAVSMLPHSHPCLMCPCLLWIHKRPMTSAGECDSATVSQCVVPSFLTAH